MIVQTENRFPLAKYKTINHFILQKVSSFWVKRYVGQYHIVINNTKIVLNDDLSDSALYICSPANVLRNLLKHIDSAERVYNLGNYKERWVKVSVNRYSVERVLDLIIINAQQ